MRIRRKWNHFQYCQFASPIVIVFPIYPFITYPIGITYIMYLITMYPIGVAYIMYLITMYPIGVAYPIGVTYPISVTYPIGVTCVYSISIYPITRLPSNRLSSEFECYLYSCQLQLESIHGSHSQYPLCFLVHSKSGTTPRSG